MPVCLSVLSSSPYFCFCSVKAALLSGQPANRTQMSVSVRLPALSASISASDRICRAWLLVAEWAVCSMECSICTHIYSVYVLCLPIPQRGRCTRNSGQLVLDVQTMYREKICIFQPPDSLLQCDSCLFNISGRGQGCKSVSRTALYQYMISFSGFAKKTKQSCLVILSTNSCSTDKKYNITLHINITL